MTGLEVVFPEAVKAEGNISVTVIPKAQLTTPNAPKLSDLSAHGVNVSMYLYNGKAKPSSATNTGTAPARLGSKDSVQEFGQTVHSIADLSYVHNPQADDTDPANAAKAVCEEGAEVYIVYRYGPDAADILAVGDKVNVWSAQLGPQNDDTTGEGEFDQLAITQAAIAKAPPIKGVAIVA